MTGPHPRTQTPRAETRRVGSWLESLGARAQEVDEKRRAAERGDDADGELGGCDNVARNGVSDQEKEPASEQRRRDEHAVVRSQHEPKGVGNDETDEAD